MNSLLSLQDIFRAGKEVADRGVTFIKSKDEDLFVSYRQLYKRASQVLKALQNKGMEAGQELLFQIDDNQSFLEVFWACILGGFIPIPVSVGTNDETRLKVFRIWQQLTDPRIVGNERTFCRLSQLAASMPELSSMLEEMTRRFLDVERLTSSEEGKVEEMDLDETAFIQFSSGSTGDPKGVIISHRNIVANLVALQKPWSVDFNDKVLSWMPLTHDMGLIAMHIMHLYTQSSQYIMNTKLFIHNPLMWMEKTNQYRVNRLFCPNFGYAYLLAFFDLEREYEWDLSCIDSIINGAEPISVELSKKFTRQLSKYGLREDAIKAVYGLAEGTVGVSISPKNKPLEYLSLDRRYLNVGHSVRMLDLDDRYGSLYANVGFPIESCEVSIAGDNGEIFVDGMVGYIRIRGSSVTNGYYNNIEASTRTIDANGWLNTGDLGFIQEESLFVIGRVKEVLSVHGQNVFAHDIERIAEELEGFGPKSFAACGVRNSHKMREEVILFILYRGKDLQVFCNLADRVKRHIHRRMDIYIDQIIPTRSIPQTTSGKIQHYKLAEQFEQGQFAKVIEEMDTIISSQHNGNSTLQKLQNLSRSILGREIGIDDPFIESGGNSLILSQITDDLLKWYGIKLSVADLYKYPTISELAAFINRGGSLMLQSVSMPEEYFAGGKGYSSAAYEAALDLERYTALQETSAEAGLNNKEVLLSIFVLLLKMVSNQNIIPVHVAINDKIFTLEIDTEAVDTFDRLIELVKVGIEAGDENSRFYYKEDLYRIQKKEAMKLVPLFIIKTTLTMNHHLYESFDLVLELTEKPDLVEMIWNFNRQRLNENKMKELFAQYAMLIDDVAINIDRD